MSGSHWEFFLRCLFECFLVNFGWFLSGRGVFGFIGLFGDDRSNGLYGSDRWRIWDLQSFLRISCEDYSRSDGDRSTEARFCPLNSLIFEGKFGGDYWVIGIYDLDLWRIWVWLRINWVSDGASQRIDCGIDSDFDISVLVENRSAQISASDAVEGNRQVSDFLSQKRRWRVRLGFERRMVWPLREPFFRWILVEFSVLLARLRSDLVRSKGLSHLVGGNQFACDGIHGLSGQFPRIFRFMLSFPEILKESNCRFVGDLRVLHTSLCNKQNREGEGLWEDSRLQTISLLAGVIMVSIWEIVAVSRDGCSGILEDYIWQSDWGLWNLYQPWFSFNSLFRSLPFVWLQLLLRFGFNSVIPIYFFGCNGVLAFYLNNKFVVSVQLKAAEYWLSVEFLWLNDIELLKQGQLESLLVVYWFKGLYFWLWLRFMVDKDLEFVYYFIVAFIGPRLMILRITLGPGVKVNNFFVIEVSEMTDLWSFIPSGPLLVSVVKGYGKGGQKGDKLPSQRMEKAELSGQQPLQSRVDK